MTTICEDLRKAVLQAAIQGRLTQQLPEDGNAEDLYKEIQAEKQMLIKEGKIKKEKQLPEIAEKEIPFEIPKNWKWVRWGNLSFSIQYGYNAPAMQKGRIRMVRISDIQNNVVAWDTVPFCEIKEDEIATYLLRENDILFARTGGTVGKSFLVKEVPFESIYAGYLIRTRYSSNLIPLYMKFFMESQLYWDQLRDGTTATAQPNCNGQKLSKMLIPLPPLAEQKRIVSRVDELMAKIDEMEQTEMDITALYEAFPGDMKASLLQAAIQGKLTEQLPEEGDAEDLYKEIQAEKQKLIKEGKIKKEKPLPVIAEDEIPFDIPENWKWVRLGDISSYAQPKKKISPASIKPEMWSLDLEDIEKDSGNISVVVKASNRKIVGDKVIFNRGQILYSKLRPYLRKILIAPDDGICTSEIVPFDCYCINDSHYMLQVLRSPYVDTIVNAVSYGVKMPRVGTDTMTNLLIPLPPLAEQKRIVEKLDQLLPLCDAMKADISGGVGA